MNHLDTLRRSSLSTVRQHAVEPLVAASGVCHVRAEQFPLESSSRVQVVDITDDVMERVRMLGVREGIATLQSLHTTCAVLVNESQDALASDIVTFLESATDPDARWRHDDPAFSDCDRQNTGAHLRALLLSSSVTLQVSGGEPVLGRWQRVLVVELDGPRARTLRLQVMGIL
jgi:secondary thiamine-phosphate synthase enzyme